MPNAPTHDLITLATVAAADIAYFRITPHPDMMLAALFTGGYVFAGYACAGDLDLNSREYRRWGLLRFLWWPYRCLVPHRSWISHGLILGGVIRALYLALVTTLMFWLSIYGYGRLGPHVDATGAVRNGWQYLVQWVQLYPNPSAAVLSGFILAGTTHSLADFIYSGFKRRLRAFR